MTNMGPFFFIICFALLVSHSVSAQSSKSKHVMVFSGSGWDSVVKSDSAGLRAALIADIGVQLDRAYAFDTTVTVDSLSTSSGNLRAEVSVNQTVLKDNADARLQHVWPPDEANSMITQGAYSTMLSMYPGPDTASLVSVQVPVEEKNGEKCDALCMRLLAMGITIAVTMGVSFAIVIVWLCCHCRCSKSEREVLTADNPLK
ncbi:hypothetical protein LSM04_002558 [Trypanosoma melophagium]|uniref:uncharacterized protein n=1 Tax=Trypanosoma melophagium TaxID=715481 RepID=UPI00351A8EC1|nr:hypothetical protein LSM04_002558 [Trypanosoma melophagium]